ncbi:flavin reductase family protein [Lentzea sp. NPDC004789]|jgi:3-hydroxy-9,10-secoandrosta-1,3,5(10)-triene-9,17-dione monooxygenase reductase component
MGSTRQNIDSRQLRDVLGHFATGVAVVTSAGESGHVGMTVNSFTSVSLSPPLVLVCAKHGSATGQDIERTGTFAVNVLCREQEALSQQFCGPADRRFDGLPVRCGVSGAPILRSALAYLDCGLEQTIDLGDHRVLVGRVLDAGASAGEEPLVFFRGEYR